MMLRLSNRLQPICFLMTYSSIQYISQRILGYIAYAWTLIYPLLQASGSQAWITCNSSADLNLVPGELPSLDNCERNVRTLIGLSMDVLFGTRSVWFLIRTAYCSKVLLLTLEALVRHRKPRSARAVVHPHVWAG